MVRISGLTFYRQDCEVLEDIKKEYPDLDSNKLKQLLSKRWKTLSKKEQAKYLDKAREAKQETLFPKNELECDEIPLPYQPNSIVVEPPKPRYNLENEIRNVQRDIDCLRDKILMC